MKDYENIILNRLLDKHQGGERGFEAEDSKQTKIRIDVWKDKALPEYMAEDSYKYRDDIDQAAISLEKDGLVLLDWDRKTKLLHHIELNQSEKKLNEAYRLTGHKRKSNVVSSEKEFIQSRLSDTEAGSTEKSYLLFLLGLVEAHKSHFSHYKDLDDLKTQVSIVRAIENQHEEILLRNFSARNFADSKLLQRNETKILRIFQGFSGDEYERIDDVYAEHGIVKNPLFAYLRYGMSFSINSQIIDFDALNDDFSMTDKEIGEMKILSISKKKVITIENLTTYYYYLGKDAIVIYLAGYHNSIKRELLKKIHDFNPSLPFYHIGDIDWGGFNILLDLRRKTGIDVHPLMMGVPELERYATECMHLYENDKKRLGLMLHKEEAKEFHGTIRYMLEHDVKLEQENLDFN